MLKSQILSSIGLAKRAVQDLVILVTHVKRGTAVHTPGSAPTYPEVSTAVSMVITKFVVDEIDGERIQAADWQGLVFPETSLPDFNTNDLIRLPPGLNHLSGDYRIVNDDKVLAGDTVALHQLQLRKL